MLANDNNKYRAGMFFTYKNKTVVVDSSVTKLGVLVFSIDDPANGFYAKPEDLMQNTMDTMNYIMRSDLLQLRMSQSIKDIINILDDVFGPKNYYMKPSFYNVDFFVENLPSLDVYYTGPKPEDYYDDSKLDNSLMLGVVFMRMNEIIFYEHKKRIKNEPYVYYHNGMIVANPQYFYACWNME